MLGRWFHRVAADPGIIERAVQSAEALNGRLYQATHGLGVGYVSWYEQCLATSSFNLGHRPQSLRFAPSTENDPRTLSRKLQCGLSADT
jgi:hypothetical protein